MFIVCCVYLAILGIGGAFVNTFVILLYIKYEQVSNHYYHNKPLQGMAPTECLPSACLPACLLPCLLAFLLACLPACLPTCLPACLPACLLTYLPACLPSCLLAWLLACLLA